MCVIAIVRDKRPDEEIVRAMFDANSAGAGVAWRASVKRETVVRWTKGIHDVDEVVQLNKTLPFPYVLHFRIPTCGGSLSELTHPFVVDDHASVDLSGETRGGVLFHNGHLNNWQDHIRDLAIASGGSIKVPDGPWSDSRAMAWMIHHLGEGMLEMFKEKLVLFTPDSIDLGNPNSFTREDTILYSNMSWKHRVKRAGYHTTPPASMSGGDDKKEEDSSVKVIGPGTEFRTSGTGTDKGTNLVPFVGPPLRYRNPETGEPISKKALKRFKKSLEADARKGDQRAKDWLHWIERFPYTTINPSWTLWKYQMEQSQKLTTT